MWKPILQRRSSKQNSYIHQNVSSSFQRWSERCSKGLYFLKKSTKCLLIITSDPECHFLSSPRSFFSVSFLCVTFQAMHLHKAGFDGSKCHSCNLSSFPFLSVFSFTSVCLLYSWKLRVPQMPPKGQHLNNHTVNLTPWNIQVQFPRFTWSEVWIDSLIKLHLNMF